MAITTSCSTFLFFAKSLGVKFDRTVTLGRLHLYATKADIQSDIDFFKNNEKTVESVIFKDEYSEPLFEILGASRLESLDFSDYEKATIIHDLNSPIPENLKNMFTAVVDGGTIEHVFNFPIAIKNCMEALEVGGHYIGITPANNFMGHGFYQFSPELYFNIFSEDNGFVVKKMIVITSRPDGSVSDWYEVMNPKDVKSRVLLTNRYPLNLMILAEKKKEVEIFSKPPQQSDYATLWTIQEALKNSKAPPQENKLKYFYRKFTPRPLKVLARNLYDLITKEKVEDEDFGTMNASHFKKIKVK